LHCAPKAESGTVSLHTATVVLVGFAEQDLKDLGKLFEQSESRMASDYRWAVQPEADVAAVLRALHQERIPVVLCDQDLMPQAWREMLAHFATVREPPSLIVSSRMADDRLWAEALNLGAYDVLARPFERDEVLRSVSLAGMHWWNRYPVRAATASAAAPAA